MWLDILIAYSLQVAVVIGVGLLLPVAFRVQTPKVRLGWLQVLFATCLLAPLWQPSVQPAVAPWVDISVMRISTVAGMPAAGGLRWRDLAAIVLAAGIVLRWLWLGLGMLRLLRYRTNAKPWSPVDDTLLHLQSRLQVQAELYVSNELRGPLTFGLWRPAVLLPHRFPAMPPNLREAIVCHELLHVRRRDWLMTLVEEIVRSLFWFHPAVRCLITEIQLVREQVVDRQSVEMTGSRETYLDALLEVARSRMHPAIALAPSFLGKRKIRKRVEVLLKEVSMSKFRLAASFAMMLAFVAGAQWFSAASFPLQALSPAGPVYSVQEDGVTAPRVLHKVEPDYTEEARDAKLQGTCVLEIEIWPDGRAHNIQVVQPLGLGLDESAMEAIEQWVLQPGLKDGEPVVVRATVEVNFKLQ